MNIKDEIMEAAKRIRDTAMHQTLAARIPESGHFGAIAQDADWLVDHLTAALPHMGGVSEEMLIAAFLRGESWRKRNDVDRYVAVPEMVEKAARDYADATLSALAPHEPAPTDTQEGLSGTGKVVAWSYEHHDFGDVWARGVILNRPDGGANPPTAHHGSPVRSVTPLVRQSDLTACQQEVERLTQERDEAFEAENEAKDCFWAIYPDWVDMKGHGITTEAARTLLADRAEAAEALNAELVKALDGLLKPFEGDDCRYDHHGYCQAHFLQEVDECCVKIARRVREGRQSNE